MRGLFTAFAWALAAYAAAYYATALAMVLLAARELRRQARRAPPELVSASAGSPLLPSVSVLVPAFDEERTIERTVLSLLGSRYPDLEVIVVNDGSRDATVARLARAFDLVPCGRRPAGALPTEPVRAVYRSRRDPRLLVVDKKNGGKADALNAGIDVARGELVCAVDADVVIHREALLRLALPFVEDPDTVAASGTIRLLNGCLQTPGGDVVPRLPSGLLGGFQVLEYARSFTIGRLFFNPWNAQLIVSGAFGLFRRALLAELGGYQTWAIGEDMELVVRIHARLRAAKRRYRILSIAHALLYTEAPHTAAELGRQRTRWHQGLLTSLRLHRGLLLDPRQGAVGMIAFPYYVFFELLSPFVELLGWLLLPLLWALGLLTAAEALPFFVAAVLLSTLVSFVAVLLDSAALDHYRSPGDRLALLALALLEPFGYHQMNLFFRLRAFARFYGNIHLRTGWVPPARAGADANAAP